MLSNKALIGSWVTLICRIINDLIKANSQDCQNQKGKKIQSRWMKKMSTIKIWYARNAERNGWGAMHAIQQFRCARGGLRTLMLAPSSPHPTNSYISANACNLGHFIWSMPGRQSVDLLYILFYVAMSNEKTERRVKSDLRDSMLITKDAVFNCRWIFPYVNVKMWNVGNYYIENGSRKLNLYLKMKKAQKK